MKIAGYIITPLGVLAFIGTLLGGHSPIGPLFWIVVGITLLILGYRKEKLPISRENRNKKDNISDAEPAQLLQEIIKQTSPENFMDPYNAERVKNATVLHHNAKDIDADQPLAVLDLMENTIKELDCNYSSELVYKYLLEIFNPTNNRGEFEWCNAICQQLYNAKRDIAEMTLIVRREIKKKETQEKTELAQLRQEKIRQQHLEDEKCKKEAIRILKVIGVVIASIAVFLIVYIPIDYHRFNKAKPNVWTMNDARIESVCAYKDGIPNAFVKYLINIPEYINECRHESKKYDTYGSSYRHEIDCSYCDYNGNNIDIDFDVQTILPFVEKKADKLKQNGFSIKYKIKSDTLVWFAYDQYSLSDGRLVGNCICTLTPSPILHSPFPNHGNENILISCNGFGLTKEVYDSIVKSLKVKLDTLQNNIYKSSHSIQKYRKVKKDDRGAIFTQEKFTSFKTTTDILITIPSCFKQIYSSNVQSLFIMNNMDAGISIISQPKESITNIVYPIDSIIETSSVKYKVAGCDAIKIEASGYYDNKEYKYISYQLVKDNGYSAYQEPIYGEVSYYDDEFQYINGVYTKQSRKRTRTILKGYKPEHKKIKNEDLYLSILLGATPEWYEENKAVIDIIIESIQIKDVQ
jgi:hypothetical protein